MKKFIFSFFVLSQVITVTAQDSAPKAPKGYWSMTTLKLAYVFGRIDLIDEHPVVPDDLQYYHDITYKVTGNDSLRLDICTPKSIEGTTPLLIFIYGEAWKHGNKDNYLGYLIKFARKGYITASVWYRTSRKATFPAAVEDVKCAIEWLAANAEEYHIDNGNIALIGGSTGGYLALLTAYTSDTNKFSGNCIPKDENYRIKAVVDLYAPVDLTNAQVIEKTDAEQFLGKSYDIDPGLYKKASPINYITKDAPPTLIFHGTIDDIVPVEQSESLRNALEVAGVPVEYHRMKGWPHFMEAGTKVNDYCRYYMTRFFNKYLN